MSMIDMPVEKDQEIPMGPLLYRCIFKILTAQASALQRYSSIVSEQLLQVFADLGVPSISFSVIEVPSFLGV